MNQRGECEKDFRSLKRGNEASQWNPKVDGEAFEATRWNVSINNETQANEICKYWGKKQKGSSRTRMRGFQTRNNKWGKPTFEMGELKMDWAGERGEGNQPSKGVKTKTNFERGKDENQLSKLNGERWSKTMRKGPIELGLNGDFMRD